MSYSEWHKARLVYQVPQLAPALEALMWVPEHLTQDGNDLVVLDDLQRAGDDEAEGVDALAGVKDEVAGRAVRGLEIHSQRAQAAIAGQPEGRVVVKHLPVEVDTDVRTHVFGTYGQHLQGGRGAGGPGTKGVKDKDKPWEEKRTRHSCIVSLLLLLYPLYQILL